MDTSASAYTYTILTIRSAPKTPDKLRLLQVYGSVVWLFRVLLRLTLWGSFEDRSQSLHTHRSWVTANRSLRRCVGRRVSEGGLSRKDEDKVRRHAMITRAFSRGLTPAQYLEKKAGLFIHGRVRLYGLRYWASRRVRQGQLGCYDHGTWERPHCAAMNSGMWDAQLPPN